MKETIYFPVQEEQNIKNQSELRCKIKNQETQLPPEEGHSSHLIQSQKHLT